MRKDAKQPKPEKTIKPICKLIEEYKMEPEKFNTHAHYDCPLCILHIKMVGDNSLNCPDCPHIIFEGKYCNSDSPYFKTKNKDRLPRLRRWKRLINAQLIKKKGTMTWKKIGHGVNL